MIDISTLLK
jgi:hypothetical protein